MSMKNDQWVWVLIHGPEGNEQLLGQKDIEDNVHFIPCFLSKDEAINGLSHLRQEMNQILTAQAIIFEDLKQYAVQNGFMVFVLNASGKITDRIGV